MNFTKILVPTDYSEHAEAALAVAVSLAKTQNGKIHIIHVASLVPYYGPPFAPNVAMELEQVNRKNFDSYMAGIHGRGSTAAGTLAHGAPHLEINRVAREWGADLVVMGTHGRGFIEHALLGSVAERVVRTSTIPVLVVPSARHKSDRV